MACRVPVQVLYSLEEGGHYGSDQGFAQGSLHTRHISVGSHYSDELLEILVASVFEYEVGPAGQGIVVEGHELDHVVALDILQDPRLVERRLVDAVIAGGAYLDDELLSGVRQVLGLRLGCVRGWCRRLGGLGWEAVAFEYI